MDEIQYEKLLNNCTENCATPYCFLKMFFMKQHPNERTLVQLKCIEIAKWSWSADAGEDIGWQKAGQRWVDDGYAIAFSKAYNDFTPILDIFKNTVNFVKEMSNIKTEDLY